MRHLIVSATEIVLKGVASPGRGGRGGRVTSDCVARRSRCTGRSAVFVIIIMKGLPPKCFH